MRQLVGAGTLSDIQGQAGAPPSNPAPQVSDSPGTNSPLENFSRGTSDVLRNIGLGFIPNIAANTMDIAKGAGSLMSGQGKLNTSSPTYDNPFRTRAESKQALQTNPFISGGKDTAGAASWGLNLMGPQTALARGLTGAVSGPLLNLSRGDTNLKNLATSSATSAALNVLIPPILKAASSGIGSLAFGKAGSKIPDIVTENGGNPLDLMGLTKSQVQGKAGEIASNSSEKLGELLDKTEQTIPGDFLEGLVDKTNTQLSPAGGTLRTGFSPMEDLLQNANVTDYQNPKTVDTASKLVDQVSNILKDVEPDAPLDEAGTPQYSVGAWNKAKQFLQGKVNYDKNPELWNDTMKIANTLQQAVKNSIVNRVPEAAGQNALTGAAAALSKNANPVLGRAQQLIAPLALGTLGYNAATGNKSTMSPYMNAMAAIGLLTSPAFASPTASTLGSQQLMGTLSSLAGSSPQLRNILGNLINSATTQQK